MPLLDILIDLDMEVGKTTSDAQKAARIYRVNKAAREVYRLAEPEEAGREEVFSLNVDSQQVALPAYVGNVRGMRYFDGRQAISLDDMRNRYNFNWAGENELWYLQFRKKEISPLSREISNQSVLTFTLPIEEEESFSITITGKTDKSERISETLNFTTEDLQKTTEYNYVSVESIVKSRITKYNLSIYDVEDNLVGEILNSEYQSYNQIYQIADTESFSSTNLVDSVEVWFKYKYQPFKNDNDCFLGTDIYDDAIVQMFLSQTSKNKDDAVAYLAKANTILGQIFAQKQSGQRTKINFKPNPYLNLPYTDVGRPFRFRR